MHGPNGSYDSHRQGGDAAPRVLWIYWAQGWESAPDLVRLCRRSWERFHPDWELRFLDDASVWEWTDIELPADVWDRMGRAHRAAHIRLQLLRDHGGAWADATCLALRPLDGWLEELLPSGFFAFRWLEDDSLLLPDRSRPERVGRKRMMASWFLASAPRNALTVRFAEAFVSYWSTLPAAAFDTPTLPSRAGAGKLAHWVAWKAVSAFVMRRPERAALWTHPVVMKGLRVRPYLVMNAIFTELMRSDAVCADIWTSTPAVSAVGAHRLQEIGLDAAGMRKELAGGLARRAPVQKLDWRTPVSADAASVLEDLLEEATG